MLRFSAFFSLFLLACNPSLPPPDLITEVDDLFGVAEGLGPPVTLAFSDGAPTMGTPFVLTNVAFMMSRGESDAGDLTISISPPTGPPQVVAVIPIAATSPPASGRVSLRQEVPPWWNVTARHSVLSEAGGDDMAVSVGVGIR